MCINNLRRLLIAIFILTHAIILQAQGPWSWINPKPQGNLLNGIHFINDDVGWAVGKMGYILRTTDGGQTWLSQMSNTTAQLNAVQFLNANVGFVVGDSGRILKTTNGCDTWTRLTSSYNYWISSLHFVNENYGWLGAGNYILATTDGGSNWTSYYQGAPYGIYGVYFLNQTTGFWVGFGGVRRTTNGGQTFTYLWDVPNNYSWNEIVFINSTTGWIVGDGGKVAKTTDGGTTWVEVGGVTISGSGMFFKDDNNGWIANYYGIYRTQNGGNSWTLTSIKKMMDVFFTPNAGFAVGAGVKIFKTTNLGDNWLPAYQNLAEDRRITSIFFNDPSVGFAVGDSGKILKTENGAISWIPQTSPSNTNLTSVYFADVNTGWITGYNIVLKTTNSGNSWKLKYTSSYENINNSFFLNSQIGWVVGDNIRKTEDGGNTWAEQTLSNVYGDYYLKGVYFVDANNGFVVGPSGWLFKTTNGGNNWNKVNTPTTVDLNKIKFLNNMTGWIVGEQGTILKTSNGGVDWDILNFGQNYTLLDFQIIDAQTLWAVGGTNPDYGSITLYTTDGGDSWQKITNPNSQCLHATYFLDKNTGWAVGEQASIIDYLDNLTIPSAPSNLIASALGSKVNLTWMDNSANETGFEIFRSDNYSGNYKKIATVYPDTSTYNDNNVNLLGTYWYRVRAVNSSGCTALCREDSATTIIATSVEKWDNVIPKQFSLKQNYPNPFNSTTSIGYQIPHEGFVKIRICDVMGREVATLVNQNQKPGKYNVEFNAANLSSGLYIYHLKVNDFISTKKMMLLK